MKNMHFDYAQHKQKGFVGILVLVVVLIAASVGGYFVYNNLQENARVQNEINESLKTRQIPINSPSPNPDETANWKTYTNNKMKISFKYPSEYDKDRSLEVFELEYGSNSTALKADNEIWVGFPHSDVLLLQLRYYKSDLTASQWWNTEGVTRYTKLVTDFSNASMPKPQTLNLPNFSISQTMVAGKEAIQAKGNVEAAQRGYITVIVVSNNGGVYLFEYGNPFDGDKDVLTSNQILSTFKFTE